MKKLGIFLCTIAVGLVVLSSCNKDEVAPKVENNNLQIEGKWQFTSLNFLSDVVKWDSTVEYSFANYFGYAPAMFGDMWGAEFTTKAVSSGQGNNFIFRNGCTG